MQSLISHLLPFLERFKWDFSLAGSASQETRGVIRQQVM